MTSYIEYGVNLTDNQKMNLASAINNKTPLTRRIKHSNLRGNDELMLTKTQIGKIRKSLSNGTGTDIKISKTQTKKNGKTWWKSFLITCIAWSKSIALRCKRAFKSCSSIGNWCCFCSWEFGN